jgi:hypothetical protein
MPGTNNLTLPQLAIDEELRVWIDPLSSEEYSFLEASILQDGCRDPLVVWGGYLLDGHNRYEICLKHGIEFQTFEKTGLKTKADAKIWMIENQLGKRNTTDFSRAACVLKLKPLLEQRAKERQVGTLKQGNSPVRPISDERGIRTDDALAKMAGVGRNTVRKVEKIIEKAAPEVIQKVRVGEMSINAAAKTVDPPKPKAPEPPRAEPSRPALKLADTPPHPDVEGDPESYGRPSEEEIAWAEAEEKAEIESLRRIAESDDKIVAALAEAKRFRELNRVLETRIEGLMNEKNAAIRHAELWKSRHKKLETQLKKLQLERAAA